MLPFLFRNLNLITNFDSIYLFFTTTNPVTFKPFYLYENYQKYIDSFICYTLWRINVNESKTSVDYFTKRHNYRNRVIDNIYKGVRTSAVLTCIIRQIMFETGVNVNNVTTPALTSLNIWGFLIVCYFGISLYILNFNVW